MTKELIVAALQLPTLGINATRLEFYFKNASKRGARIVLFGEYVLNHFFKEIKSIPLSMLKEQSSRHLNCPQRLCKDLRYGHHRANH